MLIVQNASSPATVRHAIMDCIDQDVSSFGISSAYMTLGGCSIFWDCCSRHISRQRFEAISKRIVTSLDYGITDPAALRYWLALPNTELRIAGAELLRDGRLLVPRRSYHPKLYAFHFPSKAPNVVVGSANLTSRGLTVNTEAVWMARGIQQSLSDAWLAASEGTVLANADLVQAYEDARARAPREPSFVEAEPVPREQLPVARAELLPVFSEAVVAGALRPELFNEMWVQVERLQGGSRNQLELPRGAHRFFGYRFDGYDSGGVERIGVPELVSGRHMWSDRPLTWHGDNRMERINLPTLAQGGFDYENSAILFRRLADGAFELITVPWDSDVARAWVNASIDVARLYRLGVRTIRLSGFNSSRA